MKKVIAAISALLLTGSLATVSVSALSFDDLYAWVRSEEITTDETEETSDTSETEVSETNETDDTGVTTTTIVTTTVTESEKTTTTKDTEKEKLREQIEELQRQLEERGMTIDDLSCTIDELQYALMEANNRANNNGNSGGGGGAAKAPVVTTVTQATTTEVTTVTADTDGNAELLEAVTAKDTERQFITVSTKDGSVFYIVINHEGDGENVYFLNKVDTADLNAILDPEGNNKVTEVATPPVVTEPVVTEPVKEENGFLSSISGFLPLLGIGVFALGYYFLKIKPKKNAIPDDDYDGDEDGEDFEQEEEYIEE